MKTYDEVDGITFIMRPINVRTWIEGGEDVENIANQAVAVKHCMVSPELTDAEFLLLNGALIHQMFKALYLRFFEQAKRVSLKT